MMNLKQAEQTDPYSTPSVMLDLPFKTYLELRYFNASVAKRIVDVSAAHAKYDMDNPSSSAAMTGGTLVHELVLTPDMKLYRVLPNGADMATNLGKHKMVAAYCNWLGIDPPVVDKQAEGKMLSAQLVILKDQFAQTDLYVVKEDQFEMGQKSRDNLFLNQPLAESLLRDGGDPEATILWDHPEYGFPCKARYDFLCKGNAAAFVDVKTIDEAAYKAVDLAIRKFRYYMQMAHYIDGGVAVGLGRRTPVFLFIERAAPYHSRLVTITDKYISKGRQAMRHAARIYADCMESGFWPAYDHEILAIDAPKWL